MDCFEYNALKLQLLIGYFVTQRSKFPPITNCGVGARAGAVRICGGLRCSESSTDVPRAVDAIYILEQTKTDARWPETCFAVGIWGETAA